MNPRDPDRERDEYLWDSSGTTDPQIEALERELSPLRWQPAQMTAVVQAPSLRRHVATFRAAAMLALLIATVWIVSVFSSSVDDVGTMKELRNDAAGMESMTVRSMQGSPRVGGTALAGESELLAGHWIETDSQSTAQVAVGDYGTVNIDPDSRLRLVRAQADEQRLELARGSLSAFITAPPRLFIIDTPAAAAVDLGCAYDLRVDDHGDGEIEVTLGWVSMESRGSESIVPRGGKCLTRKGAGIGTPFYADASAALIDALERYDFGNGGDAALAVILQKAASRDSLTLWHLLARAHGESRALVFDRLAELTSRPTESARARILQGDAEALLDWRDAMVWSPNLPRLKIK